MGPIGYWNDVLSRTTGLFHCSIPPISVLAEAWQTAPSAYGWLGLCGGYALVMLFTPVRPAPGDRLHCLRRYPRILVTVSILRVWFFVFSVVPFSPTPD